MGVNKVLYGSRTVIDLSGDTVTAGDLAKGKTAHNAYGTYGCLSVQWDKVDNATHYEVMVTKTDGTEKTYATSYNAFVRANYYDEFLKDGLENATVRVKAYGEDETFSLWSDNVVVTTYNF